MVELTDNDRLLLQETARMQYETEQALESINQQLTQESIPRALRATSQLDDHHTKVRSIRDHEARWRRELSKAEDLQKTFQGNMLHRPHRRRKQLSQVKPNGDFFGGAQTASKEEKERSSWANQSKKPVLHRLVENTAAVDKLDTTEGMERYFANADAKIDARLDQIAESLDVLRQEAEEIDAKTKLQNSLVEPIDTELEVIAVQQKALKAKSRKWTTRV